MTVAILYRIDSAQNMARYYRLDVQPDLFGQWRVLREWGRIGCAGQMRSDPYPTPDAATEALERQRQAKLRP